MKRMNIVITGGSGRVGRNVTAVLADDHDVINADLAPPAQDWLNPSVSFVEADVMNLERLREVFSGADAVIHLAGLDYDWGFPGEKYIDVNTRGTWHVLQAAEDAGVSRVVLCSSISICGLQEMRLDWRPQTLPVDETHENRPIYPYGVSKQIAELMGQSFVRRGKIEVVSLRPLAVIQPETLDQYIDFVDAPDRHWLFYYIMADDLARAFKAAAEVPGINGETFFIGADDSSHPQPTLTWAEKILGQLPDVVDQDLYQDQPRASIFSNRKAKRLLGWKPTSNFESLRRSYTQNNQCAS
ncbi:NAD-dependent epimerase/dehydratase family protein [Brucella inopinata]|uniref:NAD(P)-dependent oxidoreductase n=1 Tax=Brucella inopinata TaxID=1218315 RepID=A0AAW7BE47_9HYPH|nr:NAD(P)-dependent oxidoreductase [Brucella inopinata]KEY04327.1 NAD-dependent dehydratase [Brucella suis bv. 4 str. 40]MDL2334384.1 NAD(P)-dependent oxidoreductase [Brucella inopinata]